MNEKTSTGINDDRVRIGQRIVELRKQQGITQVQLADAIGVKQSSIARIESGKHAQRLDVLSRIADALGVKIDLV